MTYTQETHDVCVTVMPFFLEEASRHEDYLYMWAYQVTIQNNRDTDIHLRRRHWRIINANGKIQEVRGVGVLGVQPVLPAGHTYDYASGVALTTPSGIMSGTYYLETSSHEWLTVEIPSFSLDSPYQKILLN